METLRGVELVSRKNRSIWGSPLRVDSQVESDGDMGYGYSLVRLERIFSVLVNVSDFFSLSEGSLVTMISEPIVVWPLCNHTQLARCV